MEILHISHTFFLYYFFFILYGDLAYFSYYLFCTIFSFHTIWRFSIFLILSCCTIFSFHTLWRFSIFLILSFCTILSFHNIWRFSIFLILSCFTIFWYCGSSVKRYLWGMETTRTHKIKYTFPDDAIQLLCLSLLSSPHTVIWSSEMFVGMVIIGGSWIYYIIS